MAPAKLSSSWPAIAICVAINMLDGFDVLAASFTAPDISAQWLLTPTALGLLFSSGLAGMALGALALSPLADLAGRRAVLLLCLCLTGIAMLLSAAASGLMMLAAFRFLTGLGIGGLLSGINTVASEAAAPHQRKLAIGFVTAGYPIGGTLGGIIAIRLLASFGWPAVYVFGGLLSVLLIPLVWLLLPESPVFLESRAEAVSSAARGDVKGIRDIFSHPLLANTLLVCGAFFSLMLSFYFVLSWTPKILVDMGVSRDTGIAASVLMNLFGAIGSVLCGQWAQKIGLGRAAFWFGTLTFASIAGFSLLPPVPALLLVGASVVGFFMMGMMASLYATVADILPTHVRATGTGAGIGVGRLGAVIGPYLAGIFIAWGWAQPLYWTVLGAPALLAGLLAFKAARER